MVDSDDRRLRSVQFLGTVTNLEEFKKEKARKKAHEDSRDTRPDAEIIDFPTNEGDGPVTEIGPEDYVRSVTGQMTEEELKIARNSKWWREGDEPAPRDDPASRKADLEKSESDEGPHEHDCD
jgi:hypothetical protein